MTLNKFGVIFTFHDSFIESIKYDEFKGELILLVNFAFWMQKDFVPGSEENGLLKVTFHDVLEYKCNEGDPAGESVGILNTVIHEDGVTFNLLDDESGTFMELDIKSKAVDVEKV